MFVYTIYGKNRIIRQHTLDKSVLSESDIFRNPIYNDVIVVLLHAAKQKRTSRAKNRKWHKCKINTSFGVVV
jgi:hypothetical protein